jgi:hypothetical protein
MFRSLRLRLALSNALVLAVILVALGALVWFGLERSLDRAATNELSTAAAGQVTRIREAGSPVAPADSDVPSAAAIQTAVYTAPDGEPLGEAGEIPTWLRRYPDRVTDLRVAGERVRVVTVPAVIGGTLVAWVSTGRSLAAEDQVLARARWLLLVGGAAGSLASLWAGWWLAGPALRTRLLELARADPTAERIPAAPFDVAEVARSAARRSEQASATRLDATGPEPLDAIGDPTALEAALDAILENVAIHGGGSASIRWDVRDGDAIVRVADRGPGLDRAAAHRAFDRFYRNDRSRTRETGGAGLGLALARTLVERQGGSIELGTTPGGGLTVSIVLRAA